MFDYLEGHSHRGGGPSQVSAAGISGIVRPPEGHCPQGPGTRECTFRC